MTLYAIKRTYGKTGHDYLHAWDDQWGSSCVGSIKLAMPFATLEEAQAAAERAAAECKTIDGQVATFCTWTVVILPHPAAPIDPAIIDEVLTEHAAELHAEGCAFRVNAGASHGPDITPIVPRNCPDNTCVPWRGRDGKIGACVYCGGTVEPEPARFTACSRSTSHVQLWIVYDESNQQDVFHWYGPTGQAKCEAVAAALNALGHGKE